MCNALQLICSTPGNVVPVCYMREGFECESLTVNLEGLFVHVVLLSLAPHRCTPYLVICVEVGDNYIEDCLVQGK